MTARWRCEDCGSPWAPGAPCCPRCRSTQHIEDAEAAMTLKTNSQGVVTDSAAPPPERAAETEAEVTELQAEEAAEGAPEGAAAESPAARVPVAPPRRTRPPRTAGV